MAKQSQIRRWQAPKRFKTRAYHRCNLCGRSGGYLRRFGMCRICFRTYALRGMISGVRKSSW